MPRERRRWGFALRLGTRVGSSDVEASPASPNLLSARSCLVAEVGILLYDGVEVLDCCGPFEVFTTASRVALRRRSVDVPFSVHTIACDGRPVVARGGLQLLGSHTIADHPPLDILIVPGGVTSEAEGDQRLIGWLKRAAEEAAITASVCTGAFLLGMAGMLEGRQATSHWEDVDELERRFPMTTVRRNVRWVDNDRVLTGGDLGGNRHEPPPGLPSGGRRAGPGDGDPDGVRLEAAAISGSPCPRPDEVPGVLLAPGRRREGSTAKQLQRGQPLLTPER